MVFVYYVHLSPLPSEYRCTYSCTSLTSVLAAKHPLPRPLSRARERGAIASLWAARVYGWSAYQNHTCESLCCWCFAQRYAPLAMQNSAKVQREWYYKTGQQRGLPKKSRSSGTRVSPKTTRRCRERRKAAECRQVFGRVELLKTLLKTECYKWRRRESAAIPSPGKSLLPAKVQGILSPFWPEMACRRR